jgi:hypothetical protein
VDASRTVSNLLGLILSSRGSRVVCCPRLPYTHCMDINVLSVKTICQRLLALFKGLLDVKLL